MADEGNHPGSGRDGRDPSASQDAAASEDATSVDYPTAAGPGAEDAQVRHGGIPPGTILIHTYRVEGLLARGGMGEIYRATHTELNTEHAIKVIRPELAEQPKIVEMFRREASSLRKVRNEAVIAYDGVFRDEDGQLYLVMEFIRGRPLSEVMCESRLSVKDLRTLCDRIAAGLGAAHAKGIVHRDISPDNVILPDGQVENAKIIDFGIVKLTDPAATTIIGDDFAGKYAYVSPEQLGFFGGQVDARSDIYSLGLVLAAAAVGHPLNAASTLSAAIDARRSVPDLSEVPEELRAGLAAMLQPNPDDRLQSLREPAREDLGETALLDLADKDTLQTREDGQHLERTVIQPASPGTSGKAPAKRRARVGLGAALGVALFVVAGAIGGYVVLTASDKDGQDSGRSEGQISSGAGDDGSERIGGLTSGPREAGTSSGSSEPGTPTGAGGGSPGVSTPSPGGGEPLKSPAEPDATTGIGTAGNGSDSSSSEAGSATSAGIGKAMTGDGSPPGKSTGTLATPPPPAAGEGGTTDMAQLTGPTAAELQALRTRVGRLLDEFACADLSSAISDRGLVEVSGFLSVPADLERLKRDLAALPTIQGNKVEVAIREWPFCAAIETLREHTGIAARRAGGPEIVPNKSTGTYRDGEVFKVTVTASDRYDGYLYVAYITNRGDVAHLLPSPSAPDNAVRAGEAIILGEEGQYIIREPYGRDMIIAISTPVPLLRTIPPQIQSAQDYFALMRQALSKVEGTENDASATSGYVFITTTP